MIALEDVGQMVARMAELEARVARLEAMAVDRSSAAGAVSQ